MFFTILALAYLLPNIYLIIRIGQLFVNRKHRFPYVLAYLFAALFFPLVSWISGREDSAFLDFLGKVYGYMVAGYLYLFLTVLAFDLLLLLNRLFGIVPRDKTGSPRFRRKSLSVILVVTVGIVVAGAINFQTIRISSYQVEIPRKKAATDHFRMAFVSDFHLNVDTDTLFVRKFTNKIRDLHPDLVLFGGDIVEGHRGESGLHTFEKLFSTIRAGWGVYGVLGNHEHYARQDKGEFFARSGITLLRDTLVTAGGAVTLAGRNDSQYRWRKSIPELMKTASDSLPVILLDHRPTEPEEASRSGVDLQLSGHTHNGQMFPINLILKRMYLLTWGHRMVGPMHLFVSSGIRLWGPPVRTVGKSEIMVVDVDLK